MEFLYYCPGFADIPISAMILLAAAMALAAVPVRRKLMDGVSLGLIGAAVTVSLLANCDKLLLAALIFTAVSVYLAFTIQRRKGA